MVTCRSFWALTLLLATARGEASSNVDDGANEEACEMQQTLLQTAVGLRSVKRVKGQVASATEIASEEEATEVASEEEAMEVASEEEATGQSHGGGRINVEGSSDELELHDSSVRQRASGPGQRFALVTEGTCESNGIMLITSGIECEAAAAELGHSITWGPHGGYPDVMPGCSVRGGMLFLQDADVDCVEGTIPGSCSCAESPNSCLCRYPPAGVLCGPGSAHGERMASCDECRLAAECNVDCMWSNGPGSECVPVAHSHR